MASFRVRRLIVATGGASITGGLSVDNGLNMKTGSLVLGAAAASGTKFSSTGRMTMAGTARVLKDIWLRPTDFISGSYQMLNDSSGSWLSASMNVDITGSILAGSTGGGMAGSMLTINVLKPGSKITASPITAFAQFAKPRDADTTGCLTAYLEWTNTVGNAATTGSTSQWRVAVAYMGSGSLARTAASAAAAEPYNATAINTWMSSCIGQLPSFKATDTWGVFILQNRMDHVNDKLGSSAVAVAGVRLTYTACALGTASAE